LGIPEHALFMELPGHIAGLVSETNFFGMSRANQLPQDAQMLRLAGKSVVEPEALGNSDQNGSPMCCLLFVSPGRREVQ